MDIDRTDATALKLEPSLEVKFLARCPQCGHKHPLAYMPPLISSMCPECGLDRDDVLTSFNAKAVLTDGIAQFGNTLLKIGAWLSRFSHRK